MVYNMISKTITEMGPIAGVKKSLVLVPGTS